LKLKLDLHPICSDGKRIEEALRGVISEACEKRAAEVEIIPGKGSGALKKSVLRFLDQPDIKALYHRVEKDSDNWGRLFVHFRWDRSDPKPVASIAELTADAVCFCCSERIAVAYDPDEIGAANPWTRLVDCPACGSPNKIALRKGRHGGVEARSESGYE
jgi:hypothetical protein